MVMNPLEIKTAGSLLLKNHVSSFFKKKYYTEINSIIAPTNKALIFFIHQFIHK
jgi:hypothetical protein